MSKFISVDQFRARLREGITEATNNIKQPFIAEVKSENDQARELLFTISTPAVDRVGDTIAVDGWQLDNYRKNPVVLWAHDYTDYPVAMSRQIWAEDGKLKSIAKFVPADNPATGKTADGIYQLYKQGFMSATSVGFRPIKWAWTEDSDRKFGIDFEEQELLEYSLVPVPANAEALIEARSAGIDIEPLKEWARGILRTDGIEDIRGLENFLCDAGGFSRKDAKALASHGWKALAQRDADVQALRQLLSAAQRFRMPL